MRSSFVGIVAVLGILLALLAYSGLFIVYPPQQVLVLQFGRVQSVYTKPGLYFKIPFIQNLVVIDKRILDLDMPSKEVIAADKKRLVVDAFARYKIVDPVTYYRTVGDETQANERLSTFLEASLRAVVAQASFLAIVRDKRDALMGEIRRDVDQSAKAIGIDVIDVKIRRADLPEANSQAIFRRMQTERQREAAQIRAEGEEEARRIRSRADRDATVLVAEARRDGDKIRGDGDARRNRIFAEAYGKDPQFFSFFRAMQAYENSLSNTGTTFVLSPDTKFLDYLYNPLQEEDSLPSQEGQGSSQDLPSSKEENKTKGKDSNNSNKEVSTGSVGLFQLGHSGLEDESGEGRSAPFQPDL